VTLSCLGINTNDRKVAIAIEALGERMQDSLAREFKSGFFSFNGIYERSQVAMAIEVWENGCRTVWRVNSNLAFFCIMAFLAILMLDQ